MVSSRALQVFGLAPDFSSASSARLRRRAVSAAFQVMVDVFGLPSATYRRAPRIRSSNGVEMARQTSSSSPLRPPATAR